MKSILFVLVAIAGVVGLSSPSNALFDQVRSSQEPWDLPSGGVSFENLHPNGGGNGNGCGNDSGNNNGNNGSGGAQLPPPGVDEFHYVDCKLDDNTPNSSQ